MKLWKQIAVILLAVAGFVVYDLGIYFGYTARFVNRTSPEMQAKSIEIEKFLPFDKNSQIVSVDSDTKLSGSLPMVDGAAALFPVFSAFVNALYPEDSVKYENGDFTPDSALQYTNTRGAYQALAEGRVDVIFCAKPSQAQADYARQMGAELTLVPIGREAFVFIVNAKNPVDALTADQIRGIYSGRYTRWSQVGGDDSRIDALQRNEDSGSQTAMEAFMDGVPMKKTMLGFTGTPIGFSFRYYVEGIVANGGVKMLSVDGVYPDKAHVADGSYPITSNLYAIYDARNDNPNIPILLNWVLSEEGQRIVEESGYVPMDPS